MPSPARLFPSDQSPLSSLVSELYSSDTSEDNGDWSLGNNRAGEGTYYAYVGRKSGCKRAISESVDVPRDPFDEEDV